MDLRRPAADADALRAYVTGESSEPVLLSTFRGVPFEERSRLVAACRVELARIDGGRLAILESMLLPLDERHA